VAVVDWIKMLEGVSRNNRRVNKVWNRIQLIKEYPALADYDIYLKQPAWWVETLMNLLDAQSQYNKAHSTDK